MLAGQPQLFGRSDCWRFAVQVMRSSLLGRHSPNLGVFSGPQTPFRGLQVCSAVSTRLLTTARAKHVKDGNKPSPETLREERGEVPFERCPEKHGSWWNTWFRRLAQAAERQEPNLLLRLLGYYSEESCSLRLGKLLYRDLLRQAEAWHTRLYSSASETAAKQPPFAAWVQLVSLHMWITMHRLRPEGRFGRDVSQAIYENFWPQLRLRLVEDLGLGLVETSKYLRECEHMFYGAAIRYDEAWLSKNQEAFISALQRNIPQINAEQARALYEYTAEQLERSIHRPLDMIKGASESPSTSWDAQGTRPVQKSST